MNSKAIKTYFSRLWKNHYRLVVARLETGELIICDSRFAIKVANNEPVFADRYMFPTLPEANQTITYERGKEPLIGQPDLIKVWNDAIDFGKDLAELTAWQYRVNNCLARVLVFDNQKQGFINTEYLNMLGQDGLDFLTFHSVSPTDEPCCMNPIMAKYHEEAVGLFMPIRVEARHVHVINQFQICAANN